ncbi:hypothetical protein MLD38_033536 [Melastoma candidum]|uniref:Uncharacterized protein n=1 Tax=Melastoma candidum TaxID=119954 RepID=A0ACB9M6W0_9MYRT|nr:hypothetical protein MLD38_033536 [Melastoma candidum]
MNNWCCGACNLGVISVVMSEKMMGSCWSLYRCFGYEKSSNKIGHAVLVPEPVAAGSAAPALAADVVDLLQCAVDLCNGGSIGGGLLPRLRLLAGTVEVLAEGCSPRLRLLAGTVEVLAEGCLPRLRLLAGTVKVLAEG